MKCHKYGCDITSISPTCFSSQIDHKIIKKLTTTNLFVNLHNCGKVSVNQAFRSCLPIVNSPWLQLPNRLH